MATEVMLKRPTRPPLDLDWLEMGILTIVMAGAVTGGIIAIHRVIIDLKAWLF